MVNYPFENHHGLCCQFVVIPEVSVGSHEAERAAECNCAKNVKREVTGDGGNVNDGVAVSGANEIDHFDDTCVDVRFEVVDISAIVLASC